MQGRSLEDIEALFKEPWLKRADVLFYIRYHIKMVKGHYPHIHSSLVYAGVDAFAVFLGDGGG